MNNTSKKKADQLGMPYGTANARLRKSILFLLLKKLGENYCYQCGFEIETEDELSIEHKVPYLDSDDPVKMFFDLDNISFSHLLCNTKAARQTKTLIHPSAHSYNSNGCRCDGCKEKHAERMRGVRERKKEL